MEKCKVALYGCGTVGGGLARFLIENRKETLRRTGCDIELAYVIDKRLNELKGLTLLKGVRVTDDIDEPMRDPEVDIVVELIGGTTTAGKIVEKALQAGKDVVTANKALLAERAGELFDIAGTCERSIAFEASVAGGVPIIAALRDSFVAEPIDDVFGIINGTCNYILTRMTEDGVSYGDALVDAQKKGYAEADPTLDVEGSDSAHKLAILARLAFGLDISDGDIFCRGISDVDPSDLAYAGSLGYKLKLLATGKKHRRGVELRVHPALLHHSHPLATVNGSLNAVCVRGRTVGEVVFTGHGAGAKPTASAVMSDICRIARGVYRKEFLSFTAGNRVGKAGLAPPGDIEIKFYFRLCCRDKAGVLARVAGVLGEHEISISSCIQQGKAEGKGYVPVVFMTHHAKEQNMLEALSEINGLECIKGDETAMLRVAEV